VGGKKNFPPTVGWFAKGGLFGVPVVVIGLLGATFLPGGIFGFQGEEGGRPGEGPFLLPVRVFVFPVFSGRFLGFCGLPAVVKLRNGLGPGHHLGARALGTDDPGFAFGRKGFPSPRNHRNSKTRGVLMLRGDLPQNFKRGKRKGSDFFKGGGPRVGSTLIGALPSPVDFVLILCLKKLFGSS